MKRLIPILIAVLFFACKKESAPPKENPPGNFIQLNVPYGNDTAQKMDVYLPVNKNTTSTKFMVLIHGGAWKDGDKSEYAVFVDSLAKRFPDWAFFNLNYRLYKDGTNAFPAQENDVKKAVEFILNKSAEYQVSQDYVLCGASAGAHLALLQSYKNSKVKPKAVVSFFGPTDLASLYQTATDPNEKLLLKALTGATPGAHTEAYEKSSPIFFVNESSPPTLLLHGEKDGRVPVSQSKHLKEKLEDMHVPNRLVIYKGLSHGWLGEALTDSFNQVQVFLQEHVQ